MNPGPMLSIPLLQYRHQAAVALDHVTRQLDNRGPAGMQIEYRGARLCSPSWPNLCESLLDIEKRYCPDIRTGLGHDRTPLRGVYVRPVVRFSWVADFFIFRASPVCSEVNRSGTFRLGSGPD